MALLMFEVEDNENCAGVPQLIFNTFAEARPISHVKLPYQGSAQFHRVTGWDSQSPGGPSTAYGVKIEESGGGEALLVYGGDWGLRIMRPGLDELWDINSENQWGEAYLMLGDESGVMFET